MTDTNKSPEVAELEKKIEALSPSMKKSKWWARFKAVGGSGVLVAVLGGGWHGLQMLSKINPENLEQLEQVGDLIATNKQLSETAIRSSENQKLIIAQNEALNAKVALLQVEIDKNELQSRLNAYIVKDIVIPTLRGTELTYERNTDGAEVANTWRDKLANALRPRTELDRVHDQLNSVLREDTSKLEAKVDENAHSFDEQKVKKAKASAEDITQQYKK